MSSNPITLTEVGYGQSGWFGLWGHEKWTEPFDDKTFVSLWQQCDNIVEFMESYTHNHKDDYCPTDVSCYTRCKSIEKRFGVKLRNLKTAAQYKKEKHRMEIIQLVNQFEEQNEI